MFPNKRQDSFNRTSPAWNAIAANDAAALAELAFDPRATRGGEQTMLHYACEHDAATCVEWICKQPGVDVNVQDAQLRTPFLLACENLALKSLAVLLARADVDIRALTKQDAGALHHLCASDAALDAVSALLDRGLDAAALSSDALTPLHVAVCHDASKVAALLLDRGAAPWQGQGGKRFQPLLPLALKKHAGACAELLVARGAPLGAVDTDGRGVLHLAVKEGSPALPAILRRGEADVDLKDKMGRTPLHYAVATGSAERASLLLQSGANVDAVDGSGMAPLHVACCTGEGDLASLLLAKGARVDATDHAGNTPLHWACQRDSARCAELLLGAEADPAVSNGSGLTPLELAQADDVAAVFDKHGGGGGRGSSKRKRGTSPAGNGARAASGAAAGAGNGAGGASAPAVVQSFVDKWNEADADALASLFAEGGSLADAEGAVAVGRAAVRERASALFSPAGSTLAVGVAHWSPATGAAVLEGRLAVGRAAARRGATSKDVALVLAVDGAGKVAKAKLYTSDHV